LIARLGYDSVDEVEESKELTVEQDLFQQLLEKELQATLKRILSVSSRGIPPLTTSKNRTK
jgi:hypothetical protein